MLATLLGCAITTAAVCAVQATANYMNMEYEELMRKGELALAAAQEEGATAAQQGDEVHE